MGGGPTCTISVFCENAGNVRSRDRSRMTSDETRLQESMGDLPYRYGGFVPLSSGLDGGVVFLSCDPLSPLKASAILPKKLRFFLAASPSPWTPSGACGFPFGGGSAFSEFPPKMREK